MQILSIPLQHQRSSQTLEAHNLLKVKCLKLLCQKATVLVRWVVTYKYI